MTVNSLSNQPRTCKESPGTISVGPHSSDTQIVGRFQRGDSTAFDFLYLRYRDRIYGVICSMISNREDALDITQDIFLKAYQALGNFKRASQFYSWLYRIAINCCIDHMRRQSKHGWLSDKPVSDEVFYHQPVHPAKGLENEEFRRLLHARAPSLDPQPTNRVSSALQRGACLESHRLSVGAIYRYSQSPSLSRTPHFALPTPLIFRIRALISSVLLQPIFLQFPLLIEDYNVKRGCRRLRTCTVTGNNAETNTNS